MNHELDQIWKQTLAIVGASVPKLEFDRWLSTIRPVDFRNDTLVIEVPNKITREWVTARYSDTILNAVRKLVGKPWHIVFQLPAQVQGKARSAAMPAASSRRPASSLQDEVSSGVLNPRYTFDSFVVGKSNEFAHAASLAVAEAPASAYNPLFIYGGVGLGKTHLMQAIAHYVLEQSPRLNVVYVSTETFTNDLINAISKQSMINFRNKYRNVDVLLIDDIQFVAGKESTQEEFFHTFNALHEATKQIVISSDRPPKEIPTLEERLRSRFEWGLTTDIQAPDIETRIAILREKAASAHLHIPQEVIVYIAESIQSNIRELEGALVKVIAFSSLGNKQITLETAKDALKDTVTASEPKQVTIQDIQEITAAHYGITVSEMKGKRRTRTIVFPRQVAMYLSRTMTSASLPQIGDEFGGRDHTTVLHAYEKIEDQLDKDPSLGKQIEEIRGQLLH